MNKDVFKHYQIGISSMDAEHWALLEGMTEVNILVKKGSILEAHEKIMKLKDLLLDHFKHEEALMEISAFPFLIYHKEDHQKILSFLEKIYKNFPQTDYHKDCIEPIERLIVSHFDSMDFQYAPYYKAWLTKNNLAEGSSS
jgi:hemerythrin-like metal-binding protein